MGLAIPDENPKLKSLQEQAELELKMKKKEVQVPNPIMNPDYIPMGGFFIYIFGKYP